MVPSDALADVLGLTDTQRAKLQQFTKVIEALNQENFATPQLKQLKLTDDQMARIANGERVRTVLTPEQVQVLESNQRQGRGGGPSTGSSHGEGPRG